MKTKLLPLLLLCLAFAGCPKSCGDVVPSDGKLECAADQLRSHLDIIPKVNDCLLAANPIQCLDLIPSAAGVTIDVVLCFVRDQGNEAAASAAANPDDELSKRKADNAQAYIEAKGVTFTDSP